MSNIPAFPRRKGFRSLISDEQRRWQIYELAKRHWCAKNPNASPIEFEAAIRQIAKRLGV